MKRRTTKRANPWPFTKRKAEASGPKRRRSQLTIGAAGREARAAGYRGRESFGEWLERRGLEDRSQLVKDRLGDQWRAGVDKREREDERKAEAREAKREKRSSSAAQVEKLRDYSEKELEAHFKKGGTLASFLQGNPPNITVRYLKLRDPLGRVKEGWYVLDHNVPAGRYDSKEEAEREAAALRQIRGVRNPAGYRGRSVAELERIRNVVAAHTFDNDWLERDRARRELEKIDKALTNARRREKKAANPASRHKGYYHYQVVRPGDRHAPILPMENWTSDLKEAKQEARRMSEYSGGYPVQIYWADILEGKLSKSGGRIKAKANPAKRRGKRNPAVGAVEAYSDFHGQAPTRETTVLTRRHFHKHLAEAGELRLLQVQAAAVNARVKLTKFAGAMLTFNEARNQLFISGGDQAVDLKSFGIKPAEAHEIETLGKVLRIGYYTDKKHLGDEGGQATYVHKFRSTNRDGKHVTVRIARYPDLIYYVRDKHLEFSGGSYKIIPEGIDL